MSRSSKRLNNKKHVIVGKYILESISIGMYNHPFMIIREYIQNSADSIDQDSSGKSQRNNPCEIDIVIDGRKGSLCIKDYGPGIPALEAKDILNSLGNSTKDSQRDRGFRGIGRLSGLGYCDELRFTTKAPGEDTISSSVWNAKKLKYILSTKNNNEEASSIVDNVSSFKQNTYHGDKDDSFFCVDMENVGSVKKLLLNVPAIKSYIAQVAPVSFKSREFKFGTQIDEALRNKVPNYNTYRIKVNDEQVFKPYGDTIIVGDAKSETIDEIKYIDISENNQNLAFGWICNLSLIGRVKPDTFVDGLRLRLGNIMLGSKDLLAEIYREKRFNGYMAGEIHIVDKRLIPNARRDDIEDSSLKDDLYNSIIRNIGIPYSKKIRELSRIRSEQKKLIATDNILQKAKYLIENGYLAESQRQRIINILEDMKATIRVDDISETTKLIEELADSKHYLELNNGKVPKHLHDVYKNVFELIYRNMSNKPEAENLINTICGDIIKRS